MSYVSLMLLLPPLLPPYCCCCCCRHGTPHRWLYSNKLRVLPPEIGRMRELRKLWLDSNQLTQLPEELGDCAALQVWVWVCTHCTSINPFAPLTVCWPGSFMSA